MGFSIVTLIHIRLASSSFRCFWLRKNWKLFFKYLHVLRRKRKKQKAHLRFVWISETKLGQHWQESEIRFFFLNNLQELKTFYLWDMYGMSSIALSASGWSHRLALYLYNRICFTCLSYPWLILNKEIPALGSNGHDYPCADTYYARHYYNYTSSQYGTQLQLQLKK